MFNIPQKEIIVNDDSQVRLLGSTNGSTWVAYVAGTNLAPANAAHQAQLEGFLTTFNVTNLQLLTTAVRVRKSTGAVAVVETASFVVATTGGAKAGDLIMLRCDSIDLTPTEFQNKGFEKRYQFTSDQATAALIIAHLVATINGDKASPVTAFAGFANATPSQDDSAKITLVAKRAGVTIDGVFFNPLAATGNTVSFTRVANGTTVYGPIEDAINVTAAAALGVNTYDYVKNIQWSKNFNIDQNLNWMPLPGVIYNSYYFEVNGNVQETVGGDHIASEKHNQVKVGINVWVKQGTVLDIALNEFLIDMNV